MMARKRYLFCYASTRYESGIDRVDDLQLHPVFAGDMFSLRDGETPDLRSRSRLAVTGIYVQPDNEDKYDGNADDHCQSNLFPE
jgi:hypothetical protein